MDLISWLTELSEKSLVLRAWLTARVMVLKKKIKGKKGKAQPKTVGKKRLPADDDDDEEEEEEEPVPKAKAKPPKAAPMDDDDDDNDEDDDDDEPAPKVKAKAKAKMPAKKKPPDDDDDDDDDDEEEPIPKAKAKAVAKPKMMADDDDDDEEEEEEEEPLPKAKAKVQGKAKAKAAPEDDGEEEEEEEEGEEEVVPLKKKRLDLEGGGTQSPKVAEACPAFFCVLNGQHQTCCDRSSHQSDGSRTAAHRLDSRHSLTQPKPTCPRPSATVETLNLAGSWTMEVKVGPQASLKCVTHRNVPKRSR